MLMRHGVVGLLTIALLGCGHSDAFTGGLPPAQEGPLVAGAPTRLTFNDGTDQVASFSPDGGSLFYSFQPFKPLPPAISSRPDTDRCIGIMRAAGGTRSQICRTDAAGLDSTDAFEHAAVGSDGALLYAAFASRIGSPTVNTGTLRLATVAAPYPGTVLLRTPASVGGFSFDHIGPIRWVSATTFLVQVRDQGIFGNPFNEIKLDTFPLGIGILRGELNGGAATFSAVPGTDSASGFDLSSAKDSIYFTRLDDARLYRLPVAGGTRQVVYTESGANRRILRDPVRIGNRIAAVGQDYQQRETFRIVPPEPPYGLKPGSVVKAIGPGDGVSATLIPMLVPNSAQGTLAAFGALAASPDGCRLIVEHRVVYLFSYTTDLYSYCLGPAGQCSCG